MGLKPLVVAALLICLGGVGAAQEQNGRWRINVALDPAADSVPAFSRLLREDAAAAIDEMRDRLIAAPPPGGGALDIRDAAPFASPDYVSLRRTRRVDIGGAHPSVRIAAWTWDASENRLADLSDFVQGQLALERLSAHLRAEAAKQAHGGAPSAVWRDEIARAITPDTVATLPFTLAPSTDQGKAAALDFHFGPYEIGPYSAGALQLRAEMSLFEPFMTDRARRLFGGEPAS